MTDRKLEIKRLLIYIAFSFGLAWVIFFAIYYWKGYELGADQKIDSLVGLGMLAPFIANLITRKITKEGFALFGKKSLLLGIDFKNRKWIYFIIAVFLPWIFNEIDSLLIIIFNQNAFDKNYYENYDVNKTVTFMSPLIVMVSAGICSFAALGEEGGWRGYMMPKLINLIGMKKALLVGGIIWGLWHAPLTCVGHNFGTDYFGFPYIGILIMCMFCIFTGTILTFLTVKSESIWPAAIMHAEINASPGILKYFINNEKISAAFAKPYVLWGVQIIPTVICAFICCHKLSPNIKKAPVD